MTIEEIQLRSRFMERRCEGKPMKGPATLRHLTQLLQDYSASLRVAAMHPQYATQYMAHDLCRTIALCCEIGAALEFDLSLELDRRLPKGGR